MAAQTKAETAIELVHHLDELKQHKAKVVAELDLEIAATMRALAMLTGEAPPRNASTMAGKAETAPRAAKELELLPVAPAPKKASFADLALDALKKNPNIQTAELASLLYGEDSPKARDKARAVIYFLSTKAKKIAKRDDDGWEVVAG